MLETIDIHEPMTLDDYAAIAHLAGTVQDLRDEARVLVRQLEGRRVWMVNSTARGGGVAEMLPKMISILRELGVDTEWAVMNTDRQEFFVLTKTIHNLIHGEGDAKLDNGHREMYEAVNRENADALKQRLRPEDILVIHDPQPMAMGRMLEEEIGMRSIWRCHIGLDERLPATRTAWNFLEPYAGAYDHAVFSAAEYIPDYLAGRASIIHPALDPLSHKSRELSPHKLVGVLCNGQLALSHHPVLTPQFPEPARRLRPDGTFASAVFPDEIGLLYRPIVTQISRWDRLKGFRPLLDGFVRLKTEVLDANRSLPTRNRRRLEITRLILAGPDPASIQDDPEGKEVLAELSAAYRDIPAELQRDVALVALPMGSRKHNALMVNALQACSTIVVQNSLREGFGLTVTEAMWKHKAVMSTHARGPREQIRDAIDGRLLRDAENTEEIAATLNEMLSDPYERDAFGRNARRRVHEEFLVFTQIRHWLRCLVPDSTRA